MLSHTLQTSTAELSHEAQLESAQGAHLCPFRGAYPKGQTQRFPDKIYVSKQARHTEPLYEHSRQLWVLQVEHTSTPDWYEPGGHPQTPASFT